MSIRAHRIVKVEYDTNFCFNSSSCVGEAILSHRDTNDFRNMDGGGMIEITFSGLKEIAEDAKEYGFPQEEQEMLQQEIESLKSLGKDDEEYIIYEMY